MALENYSSYQFNLFYYFALKKVKIYQVALTFIKQVLTRIQFHLM